MKVILLESVPKVGNVNEIVEVSDGYAMNSLIPQGLARAASPANIAALERQIKENKARDDERKKELAQAIQSLHNQVISIKASANEQGTLFSAISAADLVEQIKEQKQTEIDAALIELDQTIKEIGDHKININLDETKSTLVVRVEIEE